MTAALPDLQGMFQARLTEGRRDIDGHLASGGPLMRVYDYAYVARLQEILGEDFEATHTLLGDDAFAEATRDYIGAHPSTYRSVRWLGHAFADWLAMTPPWSETPVVADMARFEWSLGLAFDAADADPLAVDALSDVPADVWPALKFSFHPALDAVTLGHDVTAFQQAVARGEDPTEAPASFDEPTTIATWREAETLAVHYRALTPDEAGGLRVVRDGGSFAGLCETLADRDEDNAAALAAGYLRNWFAAGWIVGAYADGMSWSANTGT